MFLEDLPLDEFIAIYWVQIGKTWINLRGIVYAEPGIIAGPKSSVEIRLPSSKTVQFEGKDADLIIERLKLLGNPVFMREYFKQALTRLLKGEPKKRGPKPNPEIQRKVAMLLESTVSAVAAILQSEYEEKQKQLYLSAGDTENTADRLAKSDGKAFRMEEMPKLRGYRKHYGIEAEKQKRRNSKKETPAKKIK